MSAEDNSLQDRLNFMGMDRRARELLRELRPFIAQSVGPALDVFYAKVRVVPEISRLFGDPNHMAHAKSKQLQHWDLIASGEFGSQYAEKVRAIGKTHARLGLEPRWYIGGYALVAEQLVHALINDRWPTMLTLSKKHAGGMAEAVSVLLKSVMLDMDIAISTYLDALEEQRQQAEQSRLAAQKNQSQAMQALTLALERLASGDLTTRIDTPLSGEFEKLRTDFEMTVSKLQLAMSTIRVNAGAIASGTQEISSAADDLSRRTERQAASLEETAAALEQITTTAKNAAQGARQARDTVASAKDDAEKGGSIVKAAIVAMQGIDKSSERIAEIIGVIDEITFQTNLLALNAGVEAARAGDAGRGFAVVASEVRALAQRSAQAAKEIKALISTSTTQVKDGVGLVTETGSAFDRIIAEVTDIAGVVAEIAGGAQQQVDALQEVNSAVGEIDRVTQQNAAMAEEATAASHSLAQKTTELEGLLGTFRIGDVAGGTAKRSHPIAVPEGHPATVRPSSKPVEPPVRQMTKKLNRSFSNRGAAATASSEREDY
jgi:methyl-accepting chemotaxis protein